MKKYNKFDIDRVKSAADIRDFIPGLSGRGATQYCECPECHKSGRNKGLCVTHKTNMDIAKCFSCGFTINGAIDAVQYYDKVEFIDALQIVASRYNILLETEMEKRQRAIDRSREKVKQSFCLSQLEASGLTVKDVTAKVRLDDKSGEIYLPAFQRGGMDKYFNINKNDDEMLIYYYDLWGNPVQYATRGAAGSLKPYVRIRWSNPSLHLDKDGREIKYQTPKGAPTKFYIPQYIRERFLSETHIETLIVQEGEKKAEKACKHGIASIGIQGIYNIGNAETGLIQDLQYLVQKCTIKNVVLLMDSDWDHLHREIGHQREERRRPQTVRPPGLSRGRNRALCVQRDKRRWAGVPGEKTVSRGRSLCIQSLSSLLPSSPFFSITTALPLAVTAKTYGWYDIPPVASKSFVCGSSVI